MFWNRNQTIVVRLSFTRSVSTEHKASLMKDDGE